MLRLSLQPTSLLGMCCRHFHQAVSGLTTRFDIITISDEDSLALGKHRDGFASFMHHFVLEAMHHAESSIGSKMTSYRLIKEFSSSEVRLETRYAFGGRGAEFSELLLARNRLFTMDDRTGIIFECMPNSNVVHEEPGTVGAPRREGMRKLLSAWEQHHQRSLTDEDYEPIKLVPRFILPDGDGDMPSGFKSEWSSLCGNNKMVVGSHGYEVWPAGVPPKIGSGLRNVQWVKKIDLDSGQVRHIDWGARIFNPISTALGVRPPGYLTHEAAAYSEVTQRWFFLPRRLSMFSAWDPVEDERRGANILISCSPQGEEVQVVDVRGKTEAERGYSAMRFVPGTNDRHIVATKTVEIDSIDRGSRCSTFLTVLTTDGDVLMPETLIGQHKYEGLEIIESDREGQIESLLDQFN